LNVTLHFPIQTAMVESWHGVSIFTCPVWFDEMQKTRRLLVIDEDKAP